MLGCAPGEVVYELGAHGKPRVAAASLQFSASRSEDRALYAVSEGAAVGVDLERLRDDIDLEAMARRFFSAGERATWSAVTPARRVASAFACWTRKEAWAKGQGSGLVFPLTGIEVWAGDDRPVRCGEFVVGAVDAGEGFAAALAVCAPSVEAVDAPGKADVMT